MVNEIVFLLLLWFLPHKLLTHWIVLSAKWNRNHNILYRRIWCYLYILCIAPMLYGAHNSCNKLWMQITKWIEQIKIVYFFLLSFFTQVLSSYLNEINCLTGSFIIYIFFFVILSSKFYVKLHFISTLLQFVEKCL